MKQLTISLILFLTLNSYYVFSQQQQEVLVKEIRSDFQKINSSKLTNKSFQYNNKCGVVKAIITLFYMNGKIVKIVDKGTGDGDKAAANWNYEFYYKNNELTFSYKKLTSYSEEEGENTTSEIREYFNKNQLIKIVRDKTTTYPKNIFIGLDDSRYRLKSINKTTDIHKVYECIN